jgi:hypothetical protein
MIDYAALDDVVQYGRGRAAEIIGEPYDIYRLSDGLDGREPTQGSMLNEPNKILCSFPIRMVKTNAAIAIEQTNIYDMIYTGMCDATDLKVGDVAVRVGRHRKTNEMFTLAQLRPLSYNTFIRTEVEGNISRPWGKGDSEQLLGLVDYQGAGKTTERPYILNDGYYYIGTPNGFLSPAVIPLGLQPYKRLGPSPKIQQPTTTHRVEMFSYVPLLPGLYIEPGDTISDQNGNRYMIQTISTYSVGLQGYMLIAESLFV